MNSKKLAPNLVIPSMRVASSSVRRIYAGPRSLISSQRCLATPAGGAPKGFSDKLATGPTLDDFISGDVDPAGSDRLVLGNTSACVLIYEDRKLILPVLMTLFGDGH
jgi:hypothetical protein